MDYVEVKYDDIVMRYMMRLGRQGKAFQAEGRVCATAWGGNRNSQEAGVAGRQAEGDKGCGGVRATWASWAWEGSLILSSGESFEPLGHRARLTFRKEPWVLGDKETG